MSKIETLDEKLNRIEASIIELEKAVKKGMSIATQPNQVTIEDVNKEIRKIVNIGFINGIYRNK